MMKQTLFGLALLLSLFVTDARAQVTNVVGVKREDTATATSDWLFPAGAKRCDTAATTGGTDGDLVYFCSDSLGRLWVAIGSIAAGDNDIGNVDLELAGTAVSATNPVAIRLSDGSAFVAPATDVTEDAAETAGGTGPMVLNVRRDTRASSAGATGKNATFNSSPTGDLYTSDLALAVGASGLKRTSAGTTEDEHEVKATAGVLYSITTTNTNAAARYFRCANLTAANTTPGTSTPIIDLAIPGQAAGAGFTTSFPQGFAFSTALTCWFVTGAADTDVAEVAANEIKAFYTFK